MVHQALKGALGLALGLCVAGSAHAFPLVSPTSLGGFFETGDDEVREFEFSIAVESIVTIETVSYAGGNLVGFGFADPGGGFDPILSLFDSAGLFIIEDDDNNFNTGPGPNNVDPVTLNSFDAFLQPTLAAGTYTIVVTQYDNFFLGAFGDPITNGFEGEGDPFLTSFFNCDAGQFCDSDGNDRTNRFAFNLSAQAVAVPEPASLALLGFGLIGVGLAYRRRQN